MNTVHGPSYTRLFLANLLLSASLCAAELNDDAGGPVLSEDRYYLEATCPAKGIQELLLRANHSYVLSTFIPETRGRERHLEGQWELQDDLLYLHADGTSIGFRVKSRVHRLLDKKFLYLSFRALAAPKAHFLVGCEFVDRRVVSHFLHQQKDQR